MAGYTLYQSHDFNAFVPLLSGLWKKAALLKPLTVLVQNKTLEEWLKRSVALQNGICTNIQFYTQEGIRRYLLSLFESSHERFKKRIVPSSWMWEVLIHPRLSFSPEAVEMNEIQKIRFASSLAQVFERYDKTRPSLVKAWKEGRFLLKGAPADIYESWQQPLMADIFRNSSLCRYTEEFESLLNSGEKPSKPLDTLCIAGSIFLHENNQHLLLHASSFMDIHHFMLTPSQTYMGDRSPSALLQEKSLHPLLNAWGGLLQKQQNFFTDEGKTEDVSVSVREEESDTLLGFIRREVAEGMYSPGLEKEPLPKDDTLVVRACPGKSREVEIVYQAILTELKKDPKLSLAEVAVAAPDIEEYVPWIQKVFKTPLPGHEETGLHIPFYLSQVSLEKTSVFLSGFKLLLNLVGTNFRAKDLYPLFQNSCFREKHGLTEEDLELLKEMIESLSVKWGIDAKHKKSLGYAEDEDNTWDLAFCRIVLGISMEGNELFEGILPASSVSFTDYPRLCLLMQLLKQIFSDFREISALRKSIGGWAKECSLWLKKYLTPRENIIEDEFHAGELRSVFQDFSCGEEGLLSEEKYSLSFVQFSSLLDSHLKNIKGSTGRMLSDGVTVASLRTIRTVPFKIIFVMGMEEGKFPSRESEESFDLKSNFPSMLDASQREVDRYTILELFFNAQSKLHFSFCCRDVVKNLDLKPGNVLLELEDFINRRFECPGTPFAFDTLVERHPLLSYDPLYFEEGSSLSSFSRSDYECAKSMVNKKTETGEPFVAVTEALVSENEGRAEKRISLDDLQLFARKPAESFLKKSLGIVIEEETLSFLIEEDEPWQLNSLDKWSQYSQWIETLLVKDPLADEEKFSSEFILRKRAEGKIAGNLFSEQERKKFLNEAKHIKSQILGLELGSKVPGHYFIEEQTLSFPLRGGKELPPLFFPPLTLTRGSQRIILEGRIESLFEGGFVRPVNKAPDPKHVVRQWVQYLFLRSHPLVSDKFETLKAWQIPASPEEEKKLIVFHLEKTKAEALLLLLLDAFEKNSRALFPVYFEICRELLKAESPEDYAKTFNKGFDTAKRNCPYLEEYDKREELKVSFQELRFFAEQFYTPLLMDTPKNKRRKR